MIDWRPGPSAHLSDADVRARLAAASPPFSLPPLGSLSVERTFEFAFVPHAPLEVLNCVADVRADRAELWLPSKGPVVAAQTVALTLGLPVDRVTLHVVRGGGSFGRRLFFDPAIEAALVSKAVGRPIRLLWTRADDMRHGRLRPASHHRARATHLLGQVLSYEHRMASVALDGGHGLGELLTSVGVDLLGGVGPAMFHLSQVDLYHFGPQTRVLHEVDLAFPTGSWRSVFSGQVRTVDEVMVDELARTVRRDLVGGVPAGAAALGPDACRARPGGGRRAVGPLDGARHRPGDRSPRGVQERGRVPRRARRLRSRPTPGDPGGRRSGRRPGDQPARRRGPDAGRPRRCPLGDPAGRGAHRRRRRPREQLHRLPLRTHARHPGRGRGARHAAHRRPRRGGRAGRARGRRRGHNAWARATGSLPRAFPIVP